MFQLQWATYDVKVLYKYYKKYIYVYLCVCVCAYVFRYLINEYWSESFLCKINRHIKSTHNDFYDYAASSVDKMSVLSLKESSLLSSAEKAVIN
jgi:hypothetical protein